MTPRSCRQHRHLLSKSVPVKGRCIGKPVCSAFLPTLPLPTPACTFGCELLCRSGGSLLGGGGGAAVGQRCYGVGSFESPSSGVAPRERRVSEKDVAEGSLAD